MDDRGLIELYEARDEGAVRWTAELYGRLMYGIAWDVLRDHQRAEECVSDTLLRVWGAIPPAKPGSMVAFVGRIARNVAIDRWRHERAQGRFHPGDVTLDELAAVIPDGTDVADNVVGRQLTAAVNRWLGGLAVEERVLFVQRYWFGVPVKDLARQHGIGAKVAASRLYRTRRKLAEYLRSERWIDESEGA